VAVHKFASGAIRHSAWTAADIFFASDIPKFVDRWDKF